MKIRGLGCQLRHVKHNCFGGSDFHHAKRKSQGVDDRTGICLCRWLHSKINSATNAQLANIGTSKAQMLDIAANNWEKYGGNYGQKTGKST